MTKIEWVKSTDGSQGKTWNPLAGCTVLTPGCKRCYAMKMAARLAAMGQELYVGLTKSSNAGPVWTGVMRRAADDVLLAPLRRRKPTTYFVNSMSDLFHESVPDEWIDAIFAVMALCPQHTFQVLTKRAARMRDYFAARTELGPAAGARVIGAMVAIKGSGLWVPAWPLPNVWLGVSTERQQEADERIPLLLQTPAAVRFISAEPLLGPLDISRYISAWEGRGGLLEYLDWVIVGGESGSGARPMHPTWARQLRDQCTAAGTSFFFKQWGQFVPMIAPNWPESPGCVNYYNPTMKSVGKKKAGRLLDGVEHNGMPRTAA